LLCVSTTDDGQLNYIKEIAIMTEYMDFSKGPLPDVDDKEGAPFWEGTRRGELRFPKCHNCNQFHWYPCVICPYCHSSNIEWQTISNQSKVYTWTCVRRPINQIFKIKGAHIIVLAEFPEAPTIRLLSNLIHCHPEDVYIGMPLEIIFQNIDEKLVIPIFKPMTYFSS
jgi:uncharacterized OB-fold protein